MENLRLTVDIVIFTVVGGVLKALLVKRGVPPYEGQYAIPGGFIRGGESLENAARRELYEETGVRNVFLEQLYTFGDPKRDPRGRVITVAYYALITSEKLQVVAGADAAAALWFALSDLPRLAFDHKAILDYALERLRNKLEYTTVGFQLLPPKFTLVELQTMYEAILGRRLDKRNFRRKISLLGILTPLKERQRTGRKPAQLFSLSTSRFEKLKDRGILFPF
ncbi:MAG TPA: NUDIX domain-containing protein [Terriglobia bacterium]|nr:NUDIX domain-containing protein [Terriglobia bacterium]